MHTERYNFSFSTYEEEGRHFIVVVGGARQRLDYTGNCEFYDVEENAWRELPQLNQPRVMASIVKAKEFLYVIGGHAIYEGLYKHPMHNVERLNIR